ncbi:hypothetical protein EYB25_004169 [Talaromyces marneffei]|uniref:uncharacterized protein n=1 Tax=Talaromyces marneffei TaxID=37727 RepID=UPI0012AA389B|nr:uncharacterized protein EYB26_004745 [Talaromyces marneffei]KAE8552790.1 hypothetical protein EYB25_004169 [Talaromyces marneffei]QGA17075.1 hypothetical protein EYB26_004745 [Talaromyces marneffei]
MHSTAVLHSQSFSLGYPPSSSASDCIGSQQQQQQQQQRFFSPSAAFTTGDDENHSRRIGSIGHTLSDPSTITTSANGLPYSPRSAGVQDAQFASGPGGLLISPTDGTAADSLVSNPTSLYPQQASSWSQRMTGYVSPAARIPVLHPAVNPTNSLQGGGSSLSNNPIMARDTYPSGYALSRNAFPSPSASLNDFPRYSYSSSMPQGVGNQLDTYAYVQSHRSTQSLLEAPPFCETESIGHIMGSNNQKIMPVIHAKIHKGFFQADDKWTCYRRNYFSVSCSFTFQPFLTNGTFYLQTQDQRMEPIIDWAMSISAVVNASENEIRELVQHTPKRDKQSERRPEQVRLRPQPPYFLGSNMAGSGPHSPMYGMGQQMDFPPYGMTPQQPPTQHTFERIQFQKATANNGKRRAQQQYYNLVVELHALVNQQNGQHWEKIARRISDPMVVRGRSPGHYKDERRHSSASMGDNGRGNPGDTTGRGLLQSSIDHQQYSQMPFLYDGSQRGDSHYSHGRDMPRHNSYQPQFGQINHSAEAISPLVSTSDGSLEFIFPDSLGGHESTDGGGLSHNNRYHHSHHDDGDSSFRRDSGSSGSSSSQSHVPSLDLSSNSGTLDDAFDPMIASYHSDDQEDASDQYSKQSNTERLPLSSIVNDSSQCSRGSSGGTSFSRFIDPIQESLCA